MKVKGSSLIRTPSPPRAIHPPPYPLPLPLGNETSPNLQYATEINFPERFNFREVNKNLTNFFSLLKLNYSSLVRHPTVIWQSQVNCSAHLGNLNVLVCTLYIVQRSVNLHNKAVFWIRIYWIQIQIQHFKWIRIQGFDAQKLEKNTA